MLVVFLLSLGVYSLLFVYDALPEPWSAKFWIFVIALACLTNVVNIIVQTIKGRSDDRR